MKNLVLVLLLASLNFPSCKKSNKIFNVSKQKLPFVFNRENPLYNAEGIYIDSTLFTDSLFENLKINRLHALGQFCINNSYTSLFIKEEPLKWNDRFFLVNFNDNNEPVSYMYIYEYGYEVFEVKITKDTIFKYIDYNGDIWVEKTLIDKEGQFVFLGEEDYNPN